LFLRVSEANGTSNSSGIYISDVSGNVETSGNYIWFANAGTYVMDIILQWYSSSGADLLYTWYTLNGVAIPFSSCVYSNGGKDASQICAVNLLLQTVTAGSRVQLLCYSSDGGTLRSTTVSGVPVNTAITVNAYQVTNNALPAGASVGNYLNYNGTNWVDTHINGATNNGHGYSTLLYDTSLNQIIQSASNSTTYNKTFVIDHPTKQDHYLVHACLEGPEAGVYYRGSGKIDKGTISTIIELPEYTSSFTDFTVQVTCKGKPVLLGVSDVYTNLFEVYSDNLEGAEFFWVVYAKRDSIETEPPKKKVKVQGDGPYRWIS
jgi:hypothetical protein